MKKLALAFFFLTGLNGFTGQALAKERVKLDGYAEWRYHEVLIVEGQRVQATPRTLFVGNTFARDIASIPLGSEVKVDGYRNADGSVLARKVEAKRNGSAMFEGQLHSAFEATENQWRRRGFVYEENGQRLGKLFEDGPDVERVRRIMDRLVPPSRRASEFRAYVIENDAWNAMAARTDPCSCSAGSCALWTTTRWRSSSDTSSFIRHTNTRAGSTSARCGPSWGSLESSPPVRAAARDVTTERHLSRLASKPLRYSERSRSKIATAASMKIKRIASACATPTRGGTTCPKHPSCGAGSLANTAAKPRP